MSVIVELARKMLDSSIIFPDSEALIKEGSRKNVLRAFNQLRDLIGDERESRPPTEHKLLQFVWHPKEEKELASSSLWTIYSMINILTWKHCFLRSKIFWDIISHNVPGRLWEIISQKIFQLQENTRDINSPKME